MSIFALGDKTPEVSPSAWIAHDANVIGHVEVSENASIWFGATLRGDNELIHLGQDPTFRKTVFCTRIWDIR